MNCSLLSKRYNVRKMNTNDVPLLFSLCRNNVLYYKYYPPLVTEESLLHDLTALPPKKEAKDKYYVGYFAEDKLIAVMDLIMSYPNPDIAFIGFFMCDVTIQSKGIGTSIIDELCSYMRTIGITSIRLAFVKDNPQASHFWYKNNFIKLKTFAQDNRTLVLAERKL